MKNHIVFILLYCVTSAAIAQDLCIASDKQNIVYIGLPNPITVAVENSRCKSLVVTTNNGKIERFEGQSQCSFIIYPDSPGKALISVKKKTFTGSKEIGNIIFRVHRIPDPTPMVAGKSEGTIPKSHLVVQRGVVAQLLGFDINAHIRVEKFKTVILRDGLAIYTKEVAKGPFFPEETTVFFKSLKSSDVVLFCGIHAITPDGKLRHLRPIELTIE